MFKKLSPILLLVSMTIIVGCPGWPCERGFVYDCAGNCVLRI